MQRQTFLRLCTLGLGSAFLPNLSYTKHRSSGKKVIIVGAGMAGASAARTLSDVGFEVQVLEARNRVGGRIHTFKDWGVNLELGANWIHSASHPDNYIDTLATQAKVATQETNYGKFKLYDSQGRKIGRLRTQLSMIKFEKQLAREAELLAASDSDISFLELATRSYTSSGNKQEVINRLIRGSYANNFSDDLSEVSAKYYTLEYEDYSDRTDYLVTGGYDTIVKSLLSGINVEFQSEVKEIRITGNEVVTITDNETYQSDHIILTVPLSILQQGKILFNPTLPDYKQQAFSRISMGLFNKVFMEFEEKFWPGNTDFLVFQHETLAHFGIAVNYHHYRKRPILIAMPVAESARWIETEPDHVIQQTWLNILSKAFPRKNVNLKRVKVTRWGQDVYSLGSYSYVPVGSQAKDFEAIACPVGRIHFAGEATLSAHHATVHGAYLTGIREANRIMGY